MSTLLTYYRTASEASTTSDASLLDQTNGVKSAAKKEKSNGSVKLKKVIVKNAKPKPEGEGTGTSEDLDVRRPVLQADESKRNARAEGWRHYPESYA